MDLFQVLTIIFLILVITLILWFLIYVRNLQKGIKNLKDVQKDLQSKIDSSNLREDGLQKLTDLVFDKIPHGILVLDNQLKILKINDSIASLFHLEKERVTGSKTIFIFNNKNLEDLILKAINEEKPQKGEIVFYGDEDIILEVDAIPVDFEDYQLLVLFRNITQEVEFSRLRSQFVANVSHEMRTPLTSIRGYIETAIENDLENKQTIKKYLSKTLSEVERLNFLIEDVLNLSNIEYRRNIILKQRYNIVDIINDCISSLGFLAEKNNVNIIFNFQNNPINLLTDEELFRQMVRNMIENTIFHGGTDIELKITLNEIDSDIALIFSDNGIGIDKKDLPFIFQRFYRGRNPYSSMKIGSGLGLSIVKHIVELHNGSISVSSIPNVETVFKFVFPG